MGRGAREDPSSQPSPTGWGEEQERTPHLNPLPQDGEKRPEPDEALTSYPQTQKDVVE